MKVYISADIEGITGITEWEETEKTEADYVPFAEQMTREVKAACEGAMRAGAKEIWIKDAHESGRNLKVDCLPRGIRIIRSWSGHPFSMMQELDNTFDAAIMIGYHDASGSNGNPLAHTMHAKNINYIKINNEIASEFLINTYTAALVEVPVVFVSGDEELCKSVNAFNSNIQTVATNKGVGNSVISIHPEEAIDKTKTAVELALEEESIEKCKVVLPSTFKIEINYTKHIKAYQASFYPGVKQIGPNTVLYETKDYFEVLRMFSFIV